jgi:hypothetical protein
MVGSYRDLLGGSLGAYQNLGWLVNRGGSLTAFLIFGLGTEVLPWRACC